MSRGFVTRGRDKAFSRGRDKASSRAATRVAAMTRRLRILMRFAPVSPAGRHLRRSPSSPLRQAEARANGRPEI